MILSYACYVQAFLPRVACLDYAQITDIRAVLNEELVVVLAESASVFGPVDLGRRKADSPAFKYGVASGEDCGLLGREAEYLGRLLVGVCEREEYRY